MNFQFLEKINQIDKPLFQLTKTCVVVHVNKLENLKQMDRFLDSYKALKFSQEDTESPANRITKMEIASATETFSIKKRPGLDDFLAEFYQTFQERIPILLKLFKITEREEILPNAFYEAILFPKRDLQNNTSNEHTLKNSQQKYQLMKSNHMSKSFHSDQLAFFPWYAGMIQHTQIHKSNALD